MKKIIMSILAIALTVGAVSSTAYALFSDTASVQGVTISSGNALLGVYDRNKGTDGIENTADDVYVSIEDPAIQTAFSYKLSNIFPGFKDYTELWFKNESASDFGLNLTAHVTGVDGALWALGDKVLIAFNTTGNSWSFPTTGWYTLNDLVNNQIPVGTLVKGNKNHTEYKMFIKTSTSLGNEFALKSLKANVEFTGTQIAE